MANIGKKKCIAIYLKIEIQQNLIQLLLLKVIRIKPNCKLIIRVVIN